MRAGPGWNRHEGRYPWAGDGPPDWRMPRRFTLWAPVILSFLVQVPAAIGIARINNYPPELALATIGLALVGPLALIGARRFPGPVVAVTALAAALDLLLNPHPGPPYLALAFGILSAIIRGKRIWAWISVGVAWVGTFIAGIVLEHQWSPARIALTTLGILILFGIGEAVSGRRVRAQQYRDWLAQRRQSAAEAERVRIARELHDVLAHSLSQINVQASVGLHLMDAQPEKARAALAAIKETSKSSLDEVRSVLGWLRADDGEASPLVPQPDLTRLRELTTSLEGITVELDDRTAHDAIPAAIQSAVYRIVQESLTNVSRHAVGATRVDILVDRDADGVSVEIRDNGTGHRRSQRRRTRPARDARACRTPRRLAGSRPGDAERLPRGRAPPAASRRDRDRREHPRRHRRRSEPDPRRLPQPARGGTGSRGRRRRRHRSRGGRL